jgi:hypothetical protein
MGKCPQCGAFNSMVEEVIHEEKVPAQKATVRGLSGRSEPRRIDQVAGEAEDRIHVPIGEFARVLGGGIVPGSIVLVGGDPGIGNLRCCCKWRWKCRGGKRCCMFRARSPSGRSKCARCACFNAMQSDGVRLAR